MELGRVIEVYIDVPVGGMSGGNDMADSLAPGGVGADFSNAKPVLGTTLKTIMPNPARAGLQAQNQSVSPLTLAFWHNDVSYTPFILAPASEDGKAGSSYSMAFFRFTGKISIHGATGSQFAAMELVL